MTIDPMPISGQALSCLRLALAPAVVDEAQLRALAAMGHSRELAPGQTLQMHGDAVDAVALVLAGHLLVGLADPAGKAHIVRPVGVGQFFNLLPVMDGGPAIHDARAGPSTRLLLLPAGEFLRIVLADVRLLQAVNGVLYARNRLLYGELADIALLPLRTRCARLLLQLAQEQVVALTGGRSRTVGVSQGELAEMLGYARPRVNRELRRLVEEGIVELAYHRITVVDEARLRGVAALRATQD